MHHYTQHWSVLSGTGQTSQPQLLVPLIYIHFPASDHLMFSQLNYLQFAYLLEALHNI
jgi:hypothetical protein